MERDDFRNLRIQEFVSRVHSTPYGSTLETPEAIKLAKLFLRARKFDVNRALELFKAYKHMRYSNQLEAIDPLEDGVRRELLSEKFTVLPHSSSSDPTVMIFTVRRHWPPNCTDRDVLKGIIYQLDAALLDEQTQEQGVTVIYDMTDAKYSNFGADLSMKLLSLLTGSYPARVRNILIVAAPFWFRPPYHLSRLFVKDKIRERIFAVEQRQLVNFLPLSSLPPSLGGSLCHNHVEWLRTCFDRLGCGGVSGAKGIPEDYFNPMKALYASPTRRATVAATTTSIRLNGTLGSAHRNYSLNNSSGNYQTQLGGGTVVHHFPKGGSNGVSRASTTVRRTSAESATWTYNRLHRPVVSRASILPANSNNSTGGGGGGGGNGSGVPVGEAPSPTRVSVAQFLADFPRKFPSAFEREFETRIRPVGGSGSGGGANSLATRFADRANWAKNRYVDVPCLDASAVLLPDGGYIHANYVDGYQRKRAYILTQGPLDNTAVDFWQMVWTTGASIIIMLTKIMENGRVKCGQYWPAADRAHASASAPATLRFGAFSVTNVARSLEANGLYQLSRLALSRADGGGGGETRQVEHYLFLGWPDFDVPKEPRGFLAFLDVVNERHSALSATSDSQPPPTPPPLIVHCSAGIGRTGTFTATDVCLQQAAAEGYVDVAGTVARIRQQRACSVQLAKQYAFVYLAVYTRLKAMAK